MKNQLHRVTLSSALALALLLSVSWTPAVAQTGAAMRYFPETGHWVTGDFLIKYQSIPDAVKIYGYPITEAFQDQTIGRVVQYFQNTRFELYTEYPAELRVRITPLGTYLYKAEKPLPIPDSFPDCRTFPETGFRVCYAFLDFFQEHGGAAELGYPISNFEIQDGRIVQYFQLACLEWHPELPTGERVQLSDLGKTYFDLQAENPTRLLPASVLNNRPQAVLNLQVRAYPLAAVLPQSGEQTIYVIVQDQNLQPISNASVKLTSKLPSGRQQQINVTGSTDKDGILKQVFSYSNEIPGNATVQVQAEFEGLKGNTVTSFRIWW
jgi:hypothetical protein